MGVAKRGRRSIEVGGRPYVWWVAPDLERFGLLGLTVISEDKHFNVRYQLGQDPGQEYIVVVGSQFGGGEASGPWRRFRCPRWEQGETVSSGAVRALIEWCLADADRIEVGWRAATGF